MGSTNHDTCFLSRSDMTPRGHYAARVLAGRAGELTIGRHHIHPEPEAVFPMVVQRFSYMAERKTHRYKHPPDAHTHLTRETGDRGGDNFRTPSVAGKNASCCLSNYSHSRRRRRRFRSAAGVRQKERRLHPCLVSRSWPQTPAQRGGNLPEAITSPPADVSSP